VLCREPSSKTMILWGQPFFLTLEKPPVTFMQSNMPKATHTELVTEPSLQTLDIFVCLLSFFWNKNKSLKTEKSSSEGMSNNETKLFHFCKIFDAIQQML